MYQDINTCLLNQKKIPEISMEDIFGNDTMVEFIRSYGTHFISSYDTGNKLPVWYRVRLSEFIVIQNRNQREP